MQHRQPFRKESFRDRPLHRAAADGDTKAVTECLAQDINPYEPAEKGITPLFVAVRNRKEAVVRLLLDRYEEDLRSVHETIKYRFLWKVEATGWRSRPILIAWTKEECERAVELATNCPAGIPLNAQVFVWLHHHHEGHRFVALDVVNRSKMVTVFRFIRELLPNGVLSLDRSDYRENYDNCLQMACCYSTVDIVDLLIAKGASLTLGSGPYDRTPFMAACEMARDSLVCVRMVEHLFAKHIDRFDPTARRQDGKNVVHLIVQKQDHTLLKLLMDRLVQYRVKKFRETASQAFNQIFIYRSTDEWSGDHIFYHVRSPSIKQLCARYAEQYQLDVTVQLPNTIALEYLIRQDLLLAYCFKTIRKDLSLLRLCGGFDELAILHRLIVSKRLGFVEELYRDHSETVKGIFEADSNQAYSTMRYVVQQADEPGLKFILKYHREYFIRDMDKLQESTVGMYFFKELREKKSRFVDFLMEAIPELQHAIDEAKKAKKQTYELDNEFNDLFQKLRKNFSKTVEQLEADGKVLEDYRDGTDQRSFLHTAANYGDLTLLERLLERNFDVLLPDRHSLLPIHLTYQESVFALLLAKNESAQLQYLTEEGYNLLHICCKRGFRGPDVLERLLASGIDVNGVAPDGQLPLSLACCCGNVRFLLKHGARVELLNDQLVGANLERLSYCAVWELLPHIARLDWFGKIAHRYLPWMVGSQNRDFFSCSNEQELAEHEDIRRILFDSLYKHSRQQASELFTTVCHRAIVCCSRWFLDYDYDLNYDHADYMGYTPLLGLVSYMEEPNSDIIERLLRKSINVNAVTDRKQTALILFVDRFRSAQWYGHTMETARLLVNRGVNIDAQDENGNTALHLAFGGEHWELVAFLIESNANISLRNVAGKVACEMAPTFSHSLYGFMRKL
uniref:Putative ankyrin n=1 Tax=Anopheles marajoara TaxID=58244 RepID=A0A2M4BCY9_9DIPT